MLGLTGGDSTLAQFITQNTQEETRLQKFDFEGSAIFSPAHSPSQLMTSEPIFINVKGAQESIQGINSGTLYVDFRDGFLNNY